MILVVEDDAVTRRAMTQLLALNGYQVTAVGSAEEALRLAAEGEVPDMALVDVDLPGMTGIELVENLVGRNPSLRSVYITASERERLPLGSVRHPTEHLRKPFNMNALLNVMANQPVV
jgi:CheY-like chemotaxis protein